MTVSRSTKSSPQFLLFIILMVVGLIILKIANIWVGISPADASIFFGGKKVSVSDEKKLIDSTLNIDEFSKNVEGDVFAQPGLSPEARGSQARILERLGERHKELDERETSLDLREDLMIAAEVKLEERFADFQTKKAILEALEERRNAAKNEQLQNLVSAYERMKPREAARIFEVLEDDLLVSVATDMRTQALSGVLAEMTSERARELTRLMANLNNDRDEKTISNE